MMKYFHSLGITEHDEVLHDMGIKEKEHEVFFLEMISNAKWLPFFEKIFKWGENNSINDIDLDRIKDVKESDRYCNLESK